MKKSSFEKFLNSLLKQSKILDSIVEKEAIKIVESKSKDIEKIESERVFDGKTFDDKNIKPAYKPRTVAIKTLKGQPTNRVTLTDTGEWRSNLKIKVSNKVQLVNNEWKTKSLTEKYENILGLSQKSKDFIIKEIIKKANPKLYKKLFNRRFL